MRIKRILSRVMNNFFHFLFYGPVYNRWIVPMSIVDELIGSIDKKVYYDVEVHYSDLDTMLEALDDFTSLGIKYYQRYFDCDNYAFAFMLFVNYFYHLNNVGVISGIFHNDEKSFGHAVNLVLVREDDKPVLYIFEPQTGEYAKFSKKWKNYTFDYNTIVWA